MIAAKPNQTRVVHIALTSIRAGNNDRKKFYDDELALLAESIKAEGLAQPITVRPIAGKMFEIVAGERRFRACQLAQLESIECIVKGLDDDRASAVMLLENMARTNLAPIEQAQAYKKRLDEGWELSDLAKRTGVSADTIQKRIALLSLSDTIQHALNMRDLNQFPVSHADHMVKLDGERQRIAWNIWLNSQRGLSNYAFRDICSKLQAEQDQGKLFDLEEFFLESVKCGNSEQAIAGERDPNYPILDAKSSDTCGTAIEKYIVQIEAAKGQQSPEAAILKHLHGELVRKNLVRAKIV